MDKVDILKSTPAAKMNYLKAYLAKKVQWATWQFSVLKLASASLGLLVGAYFADFWKPLLPIVWVIFIITAVWASVMWLKEMRKK